MLVLEIQTLVLMLVWPAQIHQLSHRLQLTACSSQPVSFILVFRSNMVLKSTVSGLCCLLPAATLVSMTQTAGTGGLFRHC